MAESNYKGRVYWCSQYEETEVERLRKAEYNRLKATEIAYNNLLKELRENFQAHYRAFPAPPVFHPFEIEYYGKTYVLKED